MTKITKPPLKAVIRNGQIIYGDDVSSSVIKPNELNAKHYREAQKKAYRKELLQPNQVDYAKAYPKRAKELYNDDTLRLIG